MRSPTPFLNERERLIDVFERICEAYSSSCGKYSDENIAAFTWTLRDGSFFELPEEKQIGGLEWYDQAYLGRGECLWGLIRKGLLSPEFADEMRIALMMFYLSLSSLSESREAAIRRQLAEIIAK